MDEQVNIFRPIVDGWLKKIGFGAQAKKGFSAVAKQCEQFFSADLGFMWKPEFQTQYMGGEITPKFKITIAKAFELVSIVGPVLYWRYPNRSVRSYQPIKVPPEIFGDAQDPQIMELYEEAMREQDSEVAVSETRNSLMSTYLNYSQREQPGGLSFHSEMAITEALVKGRGCLWVAPYQFPGSDRTLTGCFYDSVDNLLIDPDCTDPLLESATWIARRHVSPAKQLERRFDLKKNSLKDKGTIESADSQSTRDEAKDQMRRDAGQTNDLIVWYEVFSKCGVGGSTKDVTSNFADDLDEVVGEYAYICVAKGVDYPLNAPPDKVAKSSDEDVKDMFEWPVPYWADGEWPVSLLDFYPKPNSPWPLAPMAMGLGELMFLNVMISVLADRAYSTSREIYAYMRSAAENLQAQMSSGKHQVFLEMNDDVHKSISDILQVVQLPAVNYDIFRMIEVVSDMFDKRVGLTELAYGLNPGGVASRSAADINAKQENLRVRPDFMANKVEVWQGRAANLEKFAAQWLVKGENLSPLLGRVGGRLWDKLIAEEDPEVVVREMKAFVEANSARRPTKQLDFANIQQIAGYLVPEFSKHADATGDTSNMNAFFKTLGMALDQDTEDWQMSPRLPQPPEADEQQMQAAEEARQLEMAKSQAEIQAKQAEAQKKQAEAEEKALEVQRILNFPDEFDEVAAEEDKHDQDIRHAEEKHLQEMEFTEDEAELDLAIARGKAAVQNLRSNNGRGRISVQGDGA